MTRKKQNNEQNDKPKRKRESKLTIIFFAQDFLLEHWDWTKEELEVLQQYHNGAASIADVGKIILDRLENAGMHLANAYIVAHTADTSEKWDLESHEYIQFTTNHFHFLGKCVDGEGGTIDEIANAVGTAPQFIEKLKKGQYEYDNKLSYLIHVKYKDKYQYSVYDVVTLRGRLYTDIYCERKKAWEAAIGTVERKIAFEGIDELDHKILMGDVTREQILLDDKLFRIYARNKKRCDDLFSVYAERKACAAIQALKNEEFKITVFFIVGKSGAGKTNIVAKNLINSIENEAKMYDENWTHFVTGATNVLDNYAGEEILLMDDVRGTAMRPEDWLKLLDPYTISESSARYKNKIPSCRVIIITSTIEPIDFFQACTSCYEAENEAMDQFIRRIQALIRVIRADDYVYTDINKIKDSVQIQVSEVTKNTDGKQAEVTCADDGNYIFNKPSEPCNLHMGIWILTQMVMLNNRFVDRYSLPEYIPN